MSNNIVMHIEVVYAQTVEVHVLSLNVNRGSTIKQAIEQSGILQRCPEIDLNNNKVGVFSQVLELDESVNDGDRVEIYRPLKADPKQSRRKRAEQQKKGKS